MKSFVVISVCLLVLYLDCWFLREMLHDSNRLFQYEIWDWRQPASIISVIVTFLATLIVLANLK